MHINARDMSPSKAFCFIIEYTPYIRINMRNILLILILNHAKSYKSKQVENGRVLYVFALGSRELIDCPIYSPGRRSSQKLKWLHNGESLVQVGCKSFSIKNGRFRPHQFWPKLIGVKSFELG